MSDSHEGDYPPEAYGDPLLMELLDVFGEIAPEHCERFVRLAQRLAALPHKVQSTITPETMQYMLENDIDLRRH